MGLAAVVLSVSLPVACASSLILGVAPENQAKYAGEEFTCDGGQTRLARTAINDDYCDCADGTDEPGTSACPNSVFYCPNEAFLPKTIVSSFVNDGICDCCDGSDEHVSKSCEDTCPVLAQERIIKAKALAELQLKGYQRKMELIAEGKKKKAQAPKRAQELQRLLGQKEKELARLKGEIESAKAEAAEEAQRRREAERRKARAAQKAKEEQKDQQKTDAEATPAANSEQPAADKPKEMAADSWEDDDDEVFEDEVVGAPSPAPVYHDDSDTPGTDWGQLLRINYVVLIWQIVTEWWLHGTHPTQTVEKYLAAMPKPTALPVSSRQQAAEQSLSAYEAQAQQWEAEYRGLQLMARYDTGPDGEYLHMLGTCYEGSHLNFQYKICPFDRVVQNPGEIVLGQVFEWTGKGDKYNEMTYRHGIQCWQGPARTATVRLLCGTETRVENAAEPQKCVYTMDLITPAACYRPSESELRGEHWREHFRDEL
eukprot:comp23525_c1_seq1/m.39540 comp23525_c1_seq1/g.39540  ORF comp23525_c1_seq1/g.39540 comp23525_c1_seq1/m.39540 type:complete len:484 (-) comp23525_c1_seq1:75-1526(-)